MVCGRVVEFREVLCDVGTMNDVLEPEIYRTILQNSDGDVSEVSKRFVAAFLTLFSNALIIASMDSVV